MTDSNLVTTCTFQGQEYLFKMNVLNNNHLELLVTDKSSGEEWQCCYDATYIENVTHKTGNFKQFKVFVAMIKSGILRTSESVTLDLLTFEDLEAIRNRKITKTVGHHSNNNRRYLIVTYLVEFDKIRYPIPLEYCGPPDPLILQSTIRRLEAEVCSLREELMVKSSNSVDSRQMYALQSCIQELTEENLALQDQIAYFKKILERKPKTDIISLHKAVSNLERSVVSERNSHHVLVEKLTNDKIQLMKKLEQVKSSESSIKAKLNRVLSQSSRVGTRESFDKNPTATHSHPCIKTIYKRSDSVNGCQHCASRSHSQKSNKSTKTKQKNSVSRSSSTTERDSNHYYEYSSDLNKFSPTCSPYRRSNSKQGKLIKVSSSDASLPVSMRTARKSRSRSKKQMNYGELEEKIASLQKLLLKNMPSTSSRLHM